MVHPSVYDTKDFHDSLMMQEQRRAKRPKPDEAKVSIRLCFFFLGLLLPSFPARLLLSRRWSWCFVSFSRPAIFPPSLPVLNLISLPHSVSGTW